MSIKINWDNSGFKSLEDKIEKISQPQKVLLIDLLNPEFMTKYTDFSTLEEFVDSSPFDFSDLENIDEAELNSFVSSHSTFSSWKEMQSKAAAIYIQNQW